MTRRLSLKSPIAALLTLSALALAPSHVRAQVPGGLRGPFVGLRLLIGLVDVFFRHPGIA